MTNILKKNLPQRNPASGGKSSFSLPLPAYAPLRSDRQSEAGGICTLRDDNMNLENLQLQGDHFFVGEAIHGGTGFQGAVGE